MSIIKRANIKRESRMSVVNFFRVHHNLQFQLFPPSTSGVRFLFIRSSQDTRDIVRN